MNGDIKPIYDYHTLLNLIKLQKKKSNLMCQPQIRHLPRKDNKWGIPIKKFTPTKEKMESAKKEIRPTISHRKCRSTNSKLKRQSIAPTFRGTKRLLTITNLVTSIKCIAKLNNVNPQEELKRGIYYPFSDIVNDNISKSSSSSASLINFISPISEIQSENNNIKRMWIKKYIGRLENKVQLNQIIKAKGDHGNVNI